jgi:hypothetical protein
MWGVADTTGVLITCRTVTVAAILRPSTRLVKMQIPRRAEEPLRGSK